VPWLNDRLIFLTRAGSHAYGTNIATSDEDFRGVAIALPTHYLGFLENFEQTTFRDPDAVVYNLTKFMHLAAKANPSILELLYTDPEDHLVMTPLGERLLEARDLFLSKQVRYSFVGYAMSQLGRIERHKRWLLNPPKKQPTRAEFGLPEQAALSKEKMGAIESLVTDKLQSWDVDWEVLEPVDRIAFRGEFERVLTEMAVGAQEEQFAAAAHSIGVESNFLSLIQSERRYRSAKKNWKQYQEWKKNRNPERAALEERFGYDSKHAMHLVRLCRMGREILETGKVIVKRPDAEELLSIREGAWTYDKVIAWAKEQEMLMAQLYKTSTAVPAKPNRKALNALCVELVETGLQRTSFQRSKG
jgi:predicted nucleotidyltransferase